uniref:Tf2-1-like SH3-like domain-containing protein n=1 Tax=Fagus sylvatica TaxID=28930 RepID=A0A2N9FWF1_FAGSY
MQHIVGKLSTSSFQRYKVCVNRSSDEGVMAPGSRGVGAVFVHFSDEDSGQTGDAIGEPRVPRRSWSHYLSNAPGLADQLVASRKDSAREGGSCAAYFCKVPDLRKSELGLVRYGPANRGHRGVFGPFEGSFPIRIPARPRKTLCASVATSVGKFRNFQQNLISSACFHARGRRSSRCRISDDLGIVGKLVLPTFQRYRPCTEASLGSQDMILANRRPSEWVVSSIQFLVWSTVRSNLGQTWSTLVKLGRIWSKLSKLLEMYPGLHFKGFWARWVLVGLETARSNLGQTLVNTSQTWSTLVKLGQTLGNVSRTFFLGVFDVESPRCRIMPAWFGLSRFACRHPRKSRGTFGNGISFWLKLNFYNRSPSQTTGHSPSEAVYGLNPIEPLELAPLPITKRFSGDAEEKVKQIKKLHEQIREIFLKQNEKYSKQANKYRKPVAFKEDDLVWIHLRKERFPSKRCSKLTSRANGPCRVLQCIGENAYKIELPVKYGGCTVKSNMVATKINVGCTNFSRMVAVEINGGCTNLSRMGAAQIYQR